MKSTFVQQHVWTIGIGILCSFLLLTYAQAVSAHGDEEEEVASEKLAVVAAAPGENYHIEIEAETLDGKRIPELAITADITNVATGAVTQKMLHGMFGGNYHYGTNVALPEGEYRIVFHIAPPTFMREGSRAGSWVEEADAEVTLSAVDVPEDEYETEILRTEDMVVVFVAEPAQDMWAFPNSMMDMHDMADVHDEDTHEDMHDAMAEMVDDHHAADHDSDRDTGSTILAILTLIMGALLGFIAGKYMRSAPSASATPSDTGTGQA